MEPLFGSFFLIKSGDLECNNGSLFIVQPIARSDLKEQIYFHFSSFFGDFFFEKE